MEKIQFYKIDDDGFFLEPVVFDYKKVGELPLNLISKPIPEGFYRPKWTGTEWIEGLTESEIDAIKNRPQEPSELEKLKSAVDFILLNY
ncbi:hypothetical protein QT711_03325 [Sporosarcina saromensis]|uniref:Uncharacterized protein n=1 Tax=Sporosarcina saromensis TaxID=359365 RepID=A0ABU4G5H3_9BACL|nr:hypothetical protein [Sporosarcina saromensis]MDW0112201.1 hypothetical protein [Sporosarcina saromensis]